MSYSFNVRGATQAAVLEAVGAELDKVVEAQPMHKVDRDQALAAAKAFVELLPTNVDDRDFSVSVNGSVGWLQGEGEDPNIVITGVGFGVSASLVPAAR